jgi:hypothetical protein
MADKAKSSRFPFVPTPRDMLKPGSVDWCWQTVELLRITFERKELTDKEWERTLAEIEKHRAWDVIPPDKPFGNEDSLLEAVIGKGRDESVREVQERAVKVVPIAEHGGDRKSEARDNQGDVVTLIPTERGNSADYLAARIARDHPEILDEMKSGVFSSVRAAAVKAGIVKPKVQIPKEPEGAGRLILKHFDRDQVRELILVLEEGLRAET